MFLPEEQGRKDIYFFVPLQPLKIPYILYIPYI